MMTHQTSLTLTIETLVKQGNEIRAALLEKQRSALYEHLVTLGGDYMAYTFRQLKEQDDKDNVSLEQAIFLLTLDLSIMQLPYEDNLGNLTEQNWNDLISLATYIFPNEVPVLQFTEDGTMQLSLEEPLTAIATLRRLHYVAKNPNDPTVEVLQQALHNVMTSEYFIEKHNKANFINVQKDLLNMVVVQLQLIKGIYLQPDIPEDVMQGMQDDLWGAVTEQDKTVKVLPVVESVPNNYALNVKAAIEDALSSMPDNLMVKDFELQFQLWDDRKGYCLFSSTEIYERFVEVGSWDKRKLAEVARVINAYSVND